jgi:hypothetical protein
MATNKQEEKVQVGFSAEQLAQIKAMLKVEIVEELKAEETARVEALNAEEKKKEALIEAELIESEKKMKDRLLAQPKRNIFIPEDGNSTVHPIAVNGVIFSVKKGEQVEVPESVALAWEYSYNATRAAEAKMKVNEVPSLTVSE